MPRRSVQTVTVKPQRGYRPGIRGPAKSAEEREAERLGANKVIVVRDTLPPGPAPTPENLTPGRVGKASVSKRKLKLAKQLSSLIREIGEEVVDPQKGWTRLEAVVRRLYTDAMSGKTPAQSLLFERGWGRVPTPVQLDMRTEVLDLIEKTGVTQDELESDPILKEILGHAIEGQFRVANQTDPGTDGTAE